MVHVRRADLGHYDLPVDVWSSRSSILCAGMDILPCSVKTVRYGRMAMDDSGHCAHILHFFVSVTA